MDLIVIKQLPIIEERFKSLGEEIKAKTERAKSLICTEETYKEVKKVRADLNKESADVKEQFKSVEAQVLARWNEVKEVYKNNVELPYKAADYDLKLKISEVENSIKEEKEIKIREFFEEYKQAYSLEWLSFDMLALKIGMSDSLKKLKEQVKAFVDIVLEDVSSIADMDYPDEVMVEYKRTLKLSSSIKTVNERHIAIENERIRQEQLKNIKEAEKEVVKKVETFLPPAEKIIESEEKIYPASFTVWGTIEQLKGLKKYLSDNNIKFEDKN